MKASEKIMAAMKAIKQIFADAAPAEGATNPNVISYNVDGGDPVFLDVSSDNINGIDASDKLFSDIDLTTPYPDGTYKVTGTEFEFTVLAGEVTAITDTAGTGAGDPVSTAAPAPGVDPLANNPALDMKTPEQMREAMEKFATGTPEERITGLETLCRALMEYCFGWQLREAQAKAITDAAIATYKQGFEDQKVLNESLTKQLADQLNISKQMFEMVTELVEEPTDDPLEDEKGKGFQFSKVEGKAKSRERFMAAFEQVTGNKKENQK